MGLGLDHRMIKLWRLKYTTGYPDELAYAVICPQGKYVITDTRFVELAEQSCPGFEIVNWHFYDRSIPNAVESICTKAGIKPKPDAEIRKLVTKYEEYYYSGMGHGVGLDLHEEPFLGCYGIRTMEPGCVITMEPGIYIPGWGGVRIEDTVLITETGTEILTHFPKELMVLK